MSISKILRKLAGLLHFSCLVFYFIANKSGKEYGISRLQKLRLARKTIRNNRTITSLTSTAQHLVLINEIFRVPESLKGSVVECGCYNGASTVNLSLACGLTNRTLFACDSFEGLPNVKNDEKYEIHDDSMEYYIWEEGEFSSEDGLNGVRRNIEKYGSIEVCQFVKGYFTDTLKDINTESVVMVFEDVDVRNSVEDCLRYLWPKLQDGCRFYSHEPWSINQVVPLFFDKEWWENNLKAPPPGFYGSGVGMNVGPLICGGLGYAEKIDILKIREHGKKRVHVGSKGFEG